MRDIAIRRFQPLMSPYAGFLFNTPLLFATKYFTITKTVRLFLQITVEISVVKARAELTGPKFGPSLLSLALSLFCATKQGSRNKIMYESHMHFTAILILLSERINPATDSDQ
jgi:hypothetical protein